MNIEEKIKILETAYHDFYQNIKVELIENIVSFLKIKNTDFHISFCFYITKNTLERDFKFIISSDNPHFLFELGQIIDSQSIKKWKHMFEISLRFNHDGEIIKYGYYIVKYTKDRIIDFRINYAWKGGKRHEEIGQYIHLYEKNYIGEKETILEYKNMKVIDILYFHKKFLGLRDETLYFIYPSRNYTKSFVENCYDIKLPVYLNSNFSLYASCILKDEFHKEKLTYFSLYFGTY